MIENGHVYLAQPPLFKINKGTKGIYIKDEQELENYLIKNNDEFKKIKKALRIFKKDRIWKVENKYSKVQRPWRNDLRNFGAQHWIQDQEIYFK